MENYVKGESRTVHVPPLLAMEGAVEMKVTNASKIRNVMGFAMSSIADNNVRHMTWNGTGNAISKTISCVEIMKRKVKGLHQITQIGSLRVEDFWEPKVDGLDSLKVNTNIPAISILLSKDPLDTNNPSYQAPDAKGVAWAGVSGPTNRKRQASTKKRQDAIKDVKAAASKPRRFKDKGDSRKAGSKKIKAENTQSKT